MILGRFIRLTLKLVKYTQYIMKCMCFMGISNIFFTHKVSLPSYASINHITQPIICEALTIKINFYGVKIWVKKYYLLIFLDKNLIFYLHNNLNVYLIFYLDIIFVI